MKRLNLLYFITTIYFLAMVFWAGYFLLRTAMPSEVVLASYEQNHPHIRISDYERGEVSVILLDQVPVVVWRRNADEIEAAKQQDIYEQWPNPFSVISGQIEPQPAHDANLTVDHEWFFVSALNPSGFGCVVLSRAGDYGGFFDPCRGSHFDLSGRIRKGPSTENLRIISAHLEPSGQFFRLNLTDLPRLQH